MKMCLRNNKRILLVIVMLIVNRYAHSQVVLTNKIVDTEPIELYLELVTSIRNEGKPNKSTVEKYFNNPAIKFFKQRPDFDSLQFINNLIFVYSNKTNDSSLLNKNDDYLLMIKYRDNESIIRKSIESIKESNIDELVKRKLRPFYDKAINIDSLSIRYIYLFLDEGNGGYPGYVFNSALQTAFLDKDIIYIVSAHEAYHTVTNSIFMAKFGHIFNSKTSKNGENDQNLLWYLEIVAEEGIADLIDKPVLSKRKSPLSTELNTLRINENSRSRQKIVDLDSLFSNSSNNDNLKFLNINNFFENGGHIPGRYMALKIQENGLLKDYIKFTGNPFQFIYFYNYAVRNSNDSPKFSEKSIQVLKEIERNFTKRNKFN